MGLIRIIGFAPSTNSMADRGKPWPKVIKTRRTWRPKYEKQKVHKQDAPVLHVDENVSLEEQIAQRAHELWQQRGREHGSDLSDWFRARARGQ